MWSWHQRKNFYLDLKGKIWLREVPFQFQFFIYVYMYYVKNWNWKGTSRSWKILIWSQRRNFTLASKEKFKLEKKNFLRTGKLLPKFYLELIGKVSHWPQWKNFTVTSKEKFYLDLKGKIYLDNKGNILF